jgi:hypothetical protein
VLIPGYELNIPGLRSGYYDLRVVDSTGDVCVVGGVYLSRNATWNLTESRLEHCEGYR